MPTTSMDSHAHERTRGRRHSGRPLWRRRSVLLALAVWALVNGALLALARGHLPLHASSLATPPTVSKVLGTDLMFVEVFALMGVVTLLTRHRRLPDLADRGPVARQAALEVAGLLTYGVLGVTGGFLLGRSLGWHAFSFHLDGMVIRTDQPVVPAEALVWAGYNLMVFALAPLLVFGRRYSSEQLNLRSHDRRADLVLILVVLVLESAVQLSLAGRDSILGLSLHQALIGGVITFVLGFAGTVLPTMVFVYCLLTTRYLTLTGSVPATVILGGLTYAMLHVFDGWTAFSTPTDALVSVLFLLLFYTGPGMFKTFLTVRTGNAWVHVWAYHAIAPHTLLDTPMFVKVFGIR